VYVRLWGIQTSIQSKHFVQSHRLPDKNWAKQNENEKHILGSISSLFLWQIQATVSKMCKIERSSSLIAMRFYRPICSLYKNKQKTKKKFCQTITLFNVVDHFLCNFLCLILNRIQNRIFKVFFARCFVYFLPFAISVWCMYIRSSIDIVNDIRSGSKQLFLKHFQWSHLFWNPTPTISLTIVPR
jgi:hypothetical protein